jgi:hypothetical protein
MAFKSEVERLKKELENTTTVEKAEFLADFGYNEGLVDGERRAMERVKEAIELYSSVHRKDNSQFGRKWIDCYLFKQELGLDGNTVSSTDGSPVPPSGGEEEKK